MKEGVSSIHISIPLKLKMQLNEIGANVSELTRNYLNEYLAATQGKKEIIELEREEHALEKELEGKAERLTMIRSMIKEKEREYEKEREEQLRNAEQMLNSMPNPLRE